MYIYVSFHHVSRYHNSASFSPLPLDISRDTIHAHVYTLTDRWPCIHAHVHLLIAGPNGTREGKEENDQESVAPLSRTRQGKPDFATEHWREHCASETAEHD